MLSPAPKRARSRTRFQTIEIRPAAAADVPGIAGLVNEHAQRGNVLPRSAAAISATIGDWFVAEIDGEIVGCVSLLPYSSGLVEVRSLAVSDHFQGLGIGRQLMRAILAEARQRRIPTLFALTRVVAFFLQFGFSISDRDLFPEKVWRDCQQCPFVNHCDETAVILSLEDGSSRQGDSY